MPGTTPAQTNPNLGLKPNGCLFSRYAKLLILRACLKMVEIKF